jgi:CelD/BcsL family acetyltransferase involved in cellulose biosynthesis
MPLETHVVSNVDRDASFIARWRELAVALGNLFVTPDWYFSWLDVYGDRFSPRLILCMDGTELVGVLPLVQERKWPRAVRFAGDASADRAAPVFPSGRPEVQQALLEGAEKLTPALFVLSHLEEKARRAAALLSWHCVPGQSAKLPFASTADGWEAYLARRSRSFRADLNRKQRSFSAAHHVTFRRTNHAGELRDDLNTFFQLHDERWNDRGGSTSSTSRVRTFLGVVAQQCVEHGWLRLWQLTANGEPAAAFFGWSIGQVYSYYLAGFDSKFRRYSPGTVLLAHTIREAAEAGSRRYDLLLGDERYKERFADGVEVVQSLVLAQRRTVPFALAKLEASGRTALQRLPDRPKTVLQRTAARAGSRLPLTRTR